MPMGHIRRAMALFLLSTAFHAWADGFARPASQRLGVQSPAQIVTDKDGIPHIFAKSETDLAYLIGRRLAIG